MKNELISNLHTRFQFATVLYLFFPTLLEALGKSTGQFTSQAEALSILGYSTVIAFVILNYLVIELSKNSLPDWLTKILNWIVVVQIGAFIPILMVFGQVSNPVDFATLLPLVKILFTMSMIITIWTPIVTSILLSVGAFIRNHRITNSVDKVPKIK